MNDKEIFGKIAELEEQNTPFCCATIIEAKGSTPREVGAKMLILADGTTFGSIGGGCGENQARSAALRCLLTEGKPEVVTVDLTSDFGTRGEDVCGGKMKIFVEPLSCPFRLKS